MMFTTNPYAQAYRVEKKSEVLSKASVEIGIGLALLVLLLLLDVQHRERFDVSLTRIPALLLGTAFLLVKHLVQPKSRDWVLPLYYTFLFSFTFMQFLLIYVDFRTVHLYPTVIETLVLVIIIGMVMRASWLPALGILAVPAVVLLIMMKTTQSIQTDELFALGMPLLMVLIAFVVNYLTEQLRFDRFVALKLLQKEKEK